MVRTVRHTLLAALALAILGAAPAAAAPVAPGQVLVRYERGVSAAERRDVRADADAASARALPVPRLELLRLEPGVSVSQALAGLRRRDEVDFAQPNYRYRPEGVPDDPRFPRQWALQNTGQSIAGVAGTPDADIDAPEAWDLTTGSSSVIVGVIDTGVNVAHPDLAGNVFVNAAEAAGSPGVDDDGNGRVDDVNGFDFFNHDGDVSDDVVEHGTLVAGVIGARGDNGLGVTGVAQRVRILPLQVDDGAGFLDDAAIVEAVAYARDMGARVVNMSFGVYGAEDSAVTTAIDGAPGVLFATSAGNLNGGVANDNDAIAHWPSNLTVDHPNVVSVGNTTNRDQLAGSSSYGAQSVDLAAPGTDIFGLGLTEVFAEDFDDSASLPAGWTADGTWAVTTERSDTAPRSLTDSPGGQYANGSDTAATSPVFDVPANATCQINHSRRRRTEPGADFLRIEASVGGGPFVEEQAISGSSPSGGPPDDQFYAPATPPDFTTGSSTMAQIRFRLTTNSSVTDDGVHIDDVYVTCQPSTIGYQTGTGTSFSSPMVAGVAALMLARDGALGPATLKSRLRSSVDVLPALAGKVSTGGRLNANGAVRAGTATNGGPTLPGGGPGGPAAGPNPPSTPPVTTPAPREPDTTGPAITGARVRPFSFRALRAGAAIAARVAPRGATLRFSVDETATVIARVQRARAGRRVGGRCVATTRSNRRRAVCRRWVTVGRTRVPGRVGAGAVTRGLSGRLAGRALRPGRYRLDLVATDLTGNAGRPAVAGFRIASR